MLASVLDFLLMEDAWVMAFCTVTGLPFTAPMEARAGLPGGGRSALDLIAFPAPSLHIDGGHGQGRTGDD